MDVLAMANDKLKFIQRFYTTASEPFSSLIAKIEKHEEPYDVYDIEDSVPFDIEWQENTESLNLLGQWCLSLTQRAFKEFLDGFLVRSGNTPSDIGKRRPGEKSWFDQYRRYFGETYKIDWSRSSVDPGFLEEICLARNAIWHNGSFWDLDVRQDQKYYERFPDSLFANEWEKEAWSYSWGESLPDKPHRIEVTADKLNIANRNCSSVLYVSR